MYILKNKGVTIFELLIAISIIAIIVAIVVPSLSSFRNSRTLASTTQDIVSLLNNARNNTIASLNSTNYSVHFETGRYVYFTGSTFNNGDATNIVTTLDSSVIIPASGGINLNGAGSDVIFARLSGETTDYGTIIVRLSSDATRQKTITISKTGSISSN